MPSIKVHPSLDSFLVTPPDSATDTLIATLSSSLDMVLSPLSRFARPHQLGVCLTQCMVTEPPYGQLKDNGVKPSTQRTVLAYQSLLFSFSTSLSATESPFFQSKSQSSFSNPKKLFSIFSTLLDPPTPDLPFY